MAQVEKNLLANAGDIKDVVDPWVGKILEKVMAAYLSILAWRIT